MNNGNSVLQKVLETIRENNMIKKGERILAAVSGGADSVCMLHALSRLKNSLGFDIYCAHLNHGIRGEAADNDEKFVIELCGKLGVPIFTKTVDVIGLAKEKKLTTEEAGRLARYTFFEELSKRYGIAKTATAHNKNDNAETVLMRILRGTGIDGLKGVAYVREDGVIRPILDLSRAEVEDYCAENGLEYCTDASNFENDYTRNKIRNELIPYLEKEFNARTVDSLVRLAENARDDGAFLDNYAKRLYVRLNNPLPGKAVTLHIESLGMVEKSIASRIIRLAADDAQSGVKLEKVHIDDIFDLMTKQTGAALDLPQGLKVMVQYGWLLFEGEPEKITVNGDGETFFEEIRPGKTVFVESLGKSICLKIEDAKTYKCKVNEKAISFDLLDGQMLFIRSRRDGDRMVCFSDGRTKKIKNILIDEKIPRKDRDRIPLLCTGNEVLAIVGGRISEKYRVTNEAERILVIEYGTIEKP